MNLVKLFPGLTAGALALAFAGVPAHAASTAKRCENVVDPTPSRIYATHVGCAVAREVGHYGIGEVQSRSSWTYTSSGRRWKCRTRTGRVVFSCAAGARRVELRVR